LIPRLLTLWDNIRTSLWALPLAMVIVTSLLAVAALRAEIDIGSDPVWFLYSGSARQAPQFLGDLVTAMITMATLAISITMVVLTLAAQQLGPRLIRNFMSDWQTQASLGLFTATVVYLLLVLRSVYGDGDDVANLAITIGTALVLASLASLLVFVHHLARAIISDNIIDRVGEALDRDILRLMPEKDDERPPRPPGESTATGMVPVVTGGYVQAVDIDALVRQATDANALIELQIRPGQHAVPGTPLAHISPQASAERLAGPVQAAFVIGRTRTAVQDLEFSMHQLVEVALRALSPGINDPFTAIAVLDRLTLSLRLMMERGPARSRFADDKRIVRVVAPVSTFEGLTDAAFNQIRQTAETTPAILIRMADNIGQLLRLAQAPHRPALDKHLRLVVNAAGRGIAEEQDRKDLKDIVDATRRALRGDEPRPEAARG